jgi:MoxR-like ATPase
MAIVQARLSAYADGSNKLLDSAIEFFLAVRLRLPRKPPSTAELINWLQALDANKAPHDQDVKHDARILRATLAALAKTREDAEELDRLVKTAVGD